MPVADQRGGARRVRAGVACAKVAAGEKDKAKKDIYVGRALEMKGELVSTYGKSAYAAAIDAAVLKAVRETRVTADIGGTLGTREAGDYIAWEIR